MSPSSTLLLGFAHGQHIGEQPALVGRVGRIFVVDVGVEHVEDGAGIVGVGVAVVLAGAAPDPVGHLLAGAGVFPEDALGAEAAHGPGQAVLQEHAHQRHCFLHALAGEGAGAFADPLIERVVEPFVLLLLHLLHDQALDFLRIGRHLEAKLGRP